MTCVNSRDTITADQGRVVGSDMLADDQHTIRSHCRTADGTWIAWSNEIAGDAIDSIGTSARGDTNKGEWPTRIASAYAVSVGYFPDDGSAPVVYDLSVDPVFQWESHSTFIPSRPGFAGVPDPCSYLAPGPIVFSNYLGSLLEGWYMNVLDVQVRTDGSNVWVVVLAGESVDYPALNANIGHTDRCGFFHDDVHAGADAFTHDSDSGTLWWLYTEGPELLDDPGPNLSFRWAPARVTVFAGDLGGFTRLDAIEAKFNNLDGASGGLASGVEAAASPAEPGVLHVVWSEGGNFGHRSAAPKRGQRINYTRWNTAAKTLDTDLRYGEASGWGFSSTDLSTRYVPDDQWVWTGELALRNDHGAPIVIVWPWIASGGPVSPSSAAELWDLSGGSRNVLQTLAPSLIPTTGEAGLADPINVFGPLLTGGLSLVEPATRSQYVSSLYTDPTLTNQDVYLICVGYYSSSADPTLPGGASFAPCRVFYRIPCDGSAAFGFMDGLRKVDYSIIPAEHTARAAGFHADFVSDPDNVWMPASIPGGGGVWHLTRRCQPTWELLPAFPSSTDPDAGDALTGAWTSFDSCDDVTSPPAIVTDDAGDWIAAAGIIPPAQFGSSPVTDAAALRAKICRCCVPCQPLGIHTWHKLS